MSQGEQTPLVLAEEAQERPEPVPQHTPASEQPLCTTHRSGNPTIPPGPDPPPILLDTVVTRGHQHSAFRHEGRPFSLCLDLFITFGGMRTPDTRALIDSGVTTNLISSEFVRLHRLPTIPLANPIQPRLADGSFAANPITEMTIELTCTIRQHVETVNFYVTSLPDHPIFLGMPWLMAHDPTIVWSTGRIRFESPICLSDHRLPTSTVNATRGTVDQPTLVSFVTAPVHYLRPVAADGTTPSLKRNLAAKFVCSLLDEEHTSSDMLVRAIKHLFPSLPEIDEPSTMPLVADGIEVPADLEEARLDLLAAFDGQPHLTPRTLPASQRPTETDLEFDYALSETPSALLRVCSMLLAPTPTPSRSPGKSEFESMLDQQLDPVRPPPPPDAESLRASVPSKYHDYLDVFSPKLADRLPDSGPNDFTIDFIPDAPLPRKQKPYRQPPLLDELGQRYVSDLMAKGFIKESKSPIACPLMYVPKKGSDPPF